MDKTESRSQQEVVIYMWNKYPQTRKLLFSVPNGGNRNDREAKRLKAEGLISGVSDLVFLWKSKAYFIEMKGENFGTQSKNQKEWQSIVEAQGFEYYLCHGSAPAIDILVNIVENS